LAEDTQVAVGGLPISARCTTYIGTATGRPDRFRPENEEMSQPLGVSRSAMLEPAHRRPARILIVDDDPDFLALAEASLAAQGFAVEHASGGLRGVFLATRDVPDVVLCDLRMPGIDGFVVAAALRADPATQHTAIFACTARRDLQARAALESSAFDGVLVKPCDWDRVARLLTDAIEARRT
jgi:CheY-like chemotaxis protein